MLQTRVTQGLLPEHQKSKCLLLNSLFKKFQENRIRVFNQCNYRKKKSNCLKMQNISEMTANKNFGFDFVCHLVIYRYICAGIPEKFVGLSVKYYVKQIISI